MGKNVAVFVDVANIFYAAKAAGVDIDYVTLLKAATATRDLVRAYAYTGLDPENENQRNFHAFLARNGYRVVSKDIRKYGDGKVKANLDIELVVDMMKTARNLDVAVVISGDGDFAPAIRAVQEMGVRVEVISFRGNTSSDLMEVADKFTDITRIAKVEKDSTASGRRVAADEEDLSMTEVPDKESEGTGRGRARGRGRGRATEPAAGVASARLPRERAVRAAHAPRRRTAPLVEAAEPAEQPESVAAAGTLVVLPGERLSKARGIAALPAAQAPADEELEPSGEPPELVPGEDAEATVPVEGEPGPEGELGPEGERRRRRRRRGGRGRGRGRAGDEEPGLAEPGAEGEPLEEEEEEEIAAPPRAPRPAAFGSIWDSQMGMPTAPRPASTVPDEEFDEEEPEIPEYLLAEQRRGHGQGRGGRGSAPAAGRGGRGGYAAAVQRERYGRGGAMTTRLPQPAPRGGQGPQGGRGDRGAQPRRDMRPATGGRPDRYPESRSAEPWSEVPPELEEILRAQLAQKMAKPAEAAPVRDVAPAAEAGSPAEASRGRGRGRRKPAGETVEAVQAGPAAGPATAGAAGVEEPTAPKRRPVHKPAGGAAAPTEVPPGAPAVAAAGGVPKARRRRKPAAAADATGVVAPVAGAATAESTGAAAVAAPRRRTTRRPAVSAADASGSAYGATPSAAAEAPSTPKRRARTTTAPEA